MKKLRIPMMIPVGVNTVLSILSIFTGFMFSIDQNNVYHRESLFYLMACISYGYMIYTNVVIFMNRKRISKRYFLSLILFVLPPFFGGIIQVLFYGLSIVWVSMTISILIIFINLQNSQLYIDHLTGLYNRRQLDFYLLQKTKVTGGKMLAGIMFDLDSFKMINDRYGHFEGDKALVYTAEILKKTFRKSGFVARYGGDEFVAIIELKNSRDFIKDIDQLNTNLEEFNRQKLTPYAISLSMGYDIYDYKSEGSIHDFLKHIDSLMYEDKKSSKIVLNEE